MPDLLFLQLALDHLDLFGERPVIADQTFDLADGLQHGGVVAPAEAPADLRRERKVKALARYIAIWRGRTTLEVRREEMRSPRLTL